MAEATATINGIPLGDVTLDYRQGREAIAIYQVVGRTVEGGEVTIRGLVDFREGKGLLPLVTDVGGVAVTLEDGALSFRGRGVLTEVGYEGFGGNALRVTVRATTAKESTDG